MTRQMDSQEYLTKCVKQGKRGNQQLTVKRSSKNMNVEVDW